MVFNFFIGNGINGILGIVVLEYKVVEQITPVAKALIHENIIDTDTAG